MPSLGRRHSHTPSSSAVNWNSKLRRVQRNIRGTHTWYPETYANHTVEIPTTAKILKESSNPTDKALGAMFERGKALLKNIKPKDVTATTQTNASANATEKTQIIINRANSVKSEQIIYEQLKKEKGADEEILIKPRIYIKGGKYNWANPDFVVYNTKSGLITKIVDAKDGNWSLTDPQKELNEKGGTFRGSSRAKGIIPQKIKKGQIKVRRTNVGGG